MCVFYPCLLEVSFQWIFVSDSRYNKHNPDILAPELISQNKSVVPPRLEEDGGFNLAFTKALGDVEPMARPEPFSDSKDPSKSIMHKLRKKNLVKFLIEDDRRQKKKSPGGCPCCYKDSSGQSNTQTFDDDCRSYEGDITAQSERDGITLFNFSK